jgi:hypothetical protein
MHDAQNEIVPYAYYTFIPSQWHAVSSFVFLLPYIEQENAYNLIASKVTHFPHDGFDWNQFNDDERKELGSVSVYRCPTRRSGGALLGRSDPPSSYDYNHADAEGPLGDYVPVLHDISDDASYFWTQHFEASDLNSVSALRTKGSGWNYNAPDWGGINFEAISDGLSNQLLYGEKHIPLSLINICAITSDGNSHGYDCSIFGQYSADSAGAAIGRSLRGNRSFYFARSPDEGKTASTDFMALWGGYSYVADAGYPQFGSWHTSIINFLVGDGSVHGLSLSTSPELLERLSHASDGGVATIP